jgi:hypothetical protein
MSRGQGKKLRRPEKEKGDLGRGEEIARRKKSGLERCSDANESNESPLSPTHA